MRVEAEIASLLEGGDSYAHEFRIVRPDGDVRVIHDRGGVERDAKGRAIVLRGINFDVTAHRGIALAEIETVEETSAERLSNERVRRASEAAGFGVYDYDISSGRTHWSAELLRIVGRRGAQAVGSVAMALAQVHPEDRGRVRRETDQIIRRLGPYELVVSCATPGRQYMLDTRSRRGTRSSGS
ncbi:PAS fold-containing protein [Tranquillimonas alkanivorans]|uniref:histidine kinase n=2 Tax=Tranquillimonas alkanivorans TaxID=441119 RepID=A0A1I5VRN6_9RHOB|nr:PAS fold-containing protein [Tranquillimonas alkanivorans]